MDNDTAETGQEAPGGIGRRSVLRTSGVAGLLTLIAGGPSHSGEAKARHSKGKEKETKQREPARDGTYIAQPGEVQSKLNAAREDGGGIVRLSSGSVYDPSGTWRIWDDVTLDYNGGKVELTSDINLHRLYPTGRIVNQDVDLRGVGGYTSAVNWALNDKYVPGVVVESAFDNQAARPWEKFPDGTPLTNIAGGRIVGNWEEGTGILLENRLPHGMHFFQADLAMKQIHTGVRFRRQQNAFQISGNRFNLHLDTFSIGIHQEHNPDHDPNFQYNGRSINLDSALMNGNEFNLSTQPNIVFDEKNTKWLWKLEEGAKNVLSQQPFNWDTYGYSDNNGDGNADAWLIKANFTDQPVTDRNTNNVLIDTRAVPSRLVVDETASTEGAANGVVSWASLLTPNEEL